MSFHGCAQDRSFLCGRPFAFVRKTLSVCAEKRLGRAQEIGRPFRRLPEWRSRNGAGDDFF